MAIRSLMTQSPRITTWGVLLIKGDLLSFLPNSTPEGAKFGVCFGSVPIA